MNVRYVKLSHGEDFIAEVEETDEGYVMTNPSSLAPHPDQQGQFILVPWAPYSMDRQFEFDKDQVLFIKNAQEDITNAFAQTFGGIVTPNKKLILS